MPTDKRRPVQTTPVKDGRGEDHRTRVAREKRARMRAHLLQAVISVHEPTLNGDRAVIDDVIRRANVARGTFYQYFSSLDEAIAESSSALVAEMAAGADAIYARMEDPAMRVATGLMSFTFRASMDRPWGIFLLQSRLEGDNLIVRRIRADLASGVAAGTFAIPSAEAGLDMVLGTLRQAVRRIVAEGGGLASTQDLARMLLCGFGVTAREAAAPARGALDPLYARGPELLAWWRSPAP